MATSNTYGSGNNQSSSVARSGAQGGAGSLGGVGADLCIVGGSKDPAIYMVREIHAGIAVITEQGTLADWQGNGTTSGFRSPQFRLSICRAKFTLPGVITDVSSGAPVMTFPFDQTRFDVLFDQVFFAWDKQITFYAEDKNSNPDAEIYSPISQPAKPLLIFLQGQCFNMGTSAFENSSGGTGSLQSFLNVHAVQMNGPDKSPNIAGNYRLGNT